MVKFSIYLNRRVFVIIIYEPRHSISYKIACAGWSVFAVRLKTLWIIGCPQSALWRHRSDCSGAQTDLSLRWAHLHFCRKCCAPHTLNRNSTLPIYSLWDFFFNLKWINCLAVTLAFTCTSLILMDVKWEASFYFYNFTNNRVKKKKKGRRKKQR